ncbi:MerR family transcriptional regulator [Micromonospora sp. NBC_01796]|uniref:MerR family transcriptional regulator n=1 Tax=Micromonospora sp. NBC_01796 TaxID=2975987 RepID=UPI002DD7B1D0|nr:MerR family transcriptional regulator [Micromonospora sp. NBC_01796]WSA88809.1 MerR family transcriptional regulator [Micromonospora sp. NBC_01796]
MGDDGLSAGAVARRLGVAVTTLRTWHQRYGLGPSRHVPGQHRRYTAQDLARLEIMRRLTTEGVVPAEAARWAQRAPDVADRGESGRGARPAVDVPDRDRARPARRTMIRPRDGGGRTIPVHPAGPAARGLARAAMRLDAAGVYETVERVVAVDGVVAAWDGLLRPVLAGLGERHTATAGLIEVEHLLSRCVSEVLAVVTRRAARSGPPRILLACADEEQHSLPLEALAAALAEVGVATRQLGARVPAAALVDAVARTGPAAVVLWSHARSTADPAQLRAVLASPHRPVLLVAAGPGWHTETLPVGVPLPASLGEALSLTVTLGASADRSLTG